MNNYIVKYNDGAEKNFECQAQNEFLAKVKYNCYLAENGIKAEIVAVIPIQVADVDVLKDLLGIT